MMFGDSGVYVSRQGRLLLRRIYSVDWNETLQDRIPDLSISMSQRSDGIDFTALPTRSVYILEA